MVLVRCGVVIRGGLLRRDALRAAGAHQRISSLGRPRLPACGAKQGPDIGSEVGHNRCLNCRWREYAGADDGDGTEPLLGDLLADVRDAGFVPVSRFLSIFFGIAFVNTRHYVPIEFYLDGCFSGRKLKFLSKCLQRHHGKTSAVSAETSFDLL